MKKKLLIWLLALCMAAMLLMSQFAMAETAETTPAPTETEAYNYEDEEEQADLPLAYVNGEAVMLSTVEEYADAIASEYDEDELTEDDISEIYSTALRTAMGYVVMGQKAKELGLKTMTAEEEQQLNEQADASWEEYITMYAEAYFGYSDDASDTEKNEARLLTISFLESAGLTREVLYQEMAEQIWYEKLTTQITSDVSVSDDDAYAYFLQLVEEDKGYFEGDPVYYEFATQYYDYASYYRPAGFRGIRQILLAVDETLLNNWNELYEALNTQESGDTTVTQAQVDAAAQAILDSIRDTTDAIRARLNAGESFEALMAEYNTDEGMSIEPYNTEGYPVCKDSIVWDTFFIQAAFSVEEIGQVSEPVVGQFGVYIVEYTTDLSEGAVAYTEDVRTEMIEELQYQKESETINTVVEGWLNESEITYTDDAAYYLGETGDAAGAAAETDAE